MMILMKIYVQLLMMRVFSNDLNDDVEEVSEWAFANVDVKNQEERLTMSEALEIMSEFTKCNK